MQNEICSIEWKSTILIFGFLSFLSAFQINHIFFAASLRFFYWIYWSRQLPKLIALFVTKRPRIGEREAKSATQRSTRRKILIKQQPVLRGKNAFLSSLPFFLNRVILCFRLKSTTKNHRALNTSRSTLRWQSMMLFITEAARPDVRRFICNFIAIVG